MRATRSVVGILVLLAVMLVAALTANAGDKKTERSIEDFINAQGTACVPDGLGGCLEYLPGTNATLPLVADRDKYHFAVIDYAGLVADWAHANGYIGPDLSPELSGTITEEALADGSAEVRITLYGADVITWVMTDRYADSPVAFGRDHLEILAGDTPSVTAIKMEVTLINTVPGAPISDLADLLWNTAQYRRLVSFDVVVNGDGQLRAAFGVPDGTPGRVHVTANYVVSYTKDNPAWYDGSPVSNIDLYEVGK